MTHRINDDVGDEDNVLPLGRKGGGDCRERCGEASVLQTASCFLVWLVPTWVSLLWVIY